LALRAKERQQVGVQLLFMRAGQAMRRAGINSIQERAGMKEQAMASI
jgi:hypothetical protein